MLYARDIGTSTTYHARYTNYNSYDSWGGRGSEPLKDDTDCVFVVSFGRGGEVAAPLDGAVQEDMRRGLAFQSFEAASDYLLRLIRSATINDLTMESIVPSQAFFKGLLSIAATVRVKNLAMAGCHLDGVDADSFQQTLLQFHSVRKLVVGFRILPGQTSDGFLAAVSGKLALTELRYEANKAIDAGAVAFDVTDYGIMQFLFQHTDKHVSLQISHVNVSMTFCTGLFEKALSEPAANDLCLTMRDESLEQDLTGILDWRRSESEENTWDTGKEVYSVNAPLDKRLRLTIHKKPCGAISSLEFQRSSAPPGGGVAEQERQRNPGGFRGRRLVRF